MARERPQVSITLHVDTLARLDRLVSRLPGATRVAVLEEAALVGLPLLEQMAKAMEDARDKHGVVDEDRAKDALALWAGQQLLRLHHTDEEGDEDA